MFRVESVSPTEIVMSEVSPDVTQDDVPADTTVTDLLDLYGLRDRLEADRLGQAVTGLSDDVRSALETGGRPAALAMADATARALDEISRLDQLDQLRNMQPEQMLAFIRTTRSTVDGATE